MRKNEVQNNICMSKVETPIGPMISGMTKKGICFFEFKTEERFDLQLNRLKKSMNAKILKKRGKFQDQLEKELDEYFSGKRKKFEVPLDISGTEFQKIAWKALKKIPYGKTRSYKEHASSIGKPTAFRAVANANNQNRIPIIIPCHRVIGSNGKLVGYGGELWRKEYLLDLEAGKVKS